MTTVIGFAGLWPAILADTGATVLVTANAFPTHVEMAATFSGKLARLVYSRGLNPTVRAFEEKIAELEGAEDSFGSGMAAISSSVLAFVRPGAIRTERNDGRGAPC